MSNLRTVELHKNSIIIEPRFVLHEAVHRLCEKLEDNTCASAWQCDLGDYGGKHPYRQALDDIDSTIGQLKLFRRQMQDLAKHVHDWNEDDYCSICGADGRA